MLSGELCIATGACPNGEVMGSTSGTMTGYEIVNRAINVCVLYCLLKVWLFFHVYCWPLLPLLLGDYEVLDGLEYHGCSSLCGNIKCRVTVECVVSIIH